MVVHQSDAQRIILPEHLGIIYDSLVSSESNRSLIRLTVDGPEPLTITDNDIQSVEVDFEFLLFDSQGVLTTPLPDQISFSLPIQKNSRISFTNYLRDASITIPCTVELGANGREFTIGPNVHISADRMIIRAGTLIAKGQTKRRVEESDDMVILESAQL